MVDGLRIEALSFRADASPIDGAFRGVATLAKPGVYEYSDGVNTWREWTPPETLADPSYLDSLKMLPVTLDHPAGATVTAANVRTLAVGAIGDTVTAMPDGMLAAPLAVWDASASQSARTTHQQVSLGYQAIIEQRAGVTPDGQAYDSVQVKRRGNHVALVQEGRHGPRVRVRGDGVNVSQPNDCAYRVDSAQTPQPPLQHRTDLGATPTDKGKPMPQVKLGTQVLEIADAAAAVAIQQHIDTVTAKAAAVDAEKTRADTAAGEVAGLKAQIETIKADHAKALEAVKADAAATARARVQLEAETVEVCGADHKCDGKTDDELRKDALVKLGVEVPADATGDYLRGALSAAKAGRRADSPASAFARDMGNRNHAPAPAFDSNKL